MTHSIITALFALLASAAFLYTAISIYRMSRKGYKIRFAFRDEWRFIGIVALVEVLAILNLMFHFKWIALP